jgi:hypothetical protein
MLNTLTIFFKYQPLLFYIILSANNRWIKNVFLDYFLLFCSSFLVVCILVLVCLSKLSLKEIWLPCILNVAYIALVCFFPV